MNNTTVTALTPAHAAGVVNVTVTTPIARATLTNAYTYAAAPSITSITPNLGPVSGNQAVTITGTNLYGATTVTLDGTTLPLLYLGCNVNICANSTCTGVESNMVVFT